ncbi:hypothetical protein JAAARDRAFT_201364 [Jaapia argillacea MUCL 33604]|uniref:Uncharacterized protein n=1 Tax=Jaapia argillacea MUCL 33604 TaxID=933084 RepID=A0A067P1S5_9AGAM|nr:hypothetical protein JAAARDRAFT_201364 [Jaapia argillacea MUCL 33604]
MASSLTAAPIAGQVKSRERRSELWLNVRRIVDGPNSDYPQGAAPLDASSLTDWSVINTLQAENQLILDTILGRLSLSIKAYVSRHGQGENISQTDLVDWSLGVQTELFIYQLNWGIASEAGMVQSMPPPMLEDLHKFFCRCQPPSRDWSPAVAAIANVPEDLVLRASYSNLHLNHWWDEDDLPEAVGGLAACLNLRLSTVREIMAGIDERSQIISALPPLGDAGPLPYRPSSITSTALELDRELQWAHSNIYCFHPPTVDQSPLPSHLYEALKALTPELAYPKFSDPRPLLLMRQNYIDQYNAVLEAQRVFKEKLLVMSLTSQAYSKVMYETYPPANE